MFYEWKRGESLGFYYAGTNLKFNSIESSNVQSSNEMYFSCFLRSATLPHSLLIMGPHTGLKILQIKLQSGLNSG